MYFRLDRVRVCVPTGPGFLIGSLTVANELFMYLRYLAEIDTVNINSLQRFASERVIHEMRLTASV